MLPNQVNIEEESKVANASAQKAVATGAAVIGGSAAIVGSVAAGEVATLATASTANSPAMEASPA